LPEEAVMCGGKAYDLFINPSFDLAKWVVEQGYPEESFQYYRVYPQEAEEMCGGVYEEELTEETTNEKMGDMKFTTAGDFIKEQDKFTQQQWDRTVGYGKVPEKYKKGDDDKYCYPGSDPQE